MDKTRILFVDDENSILQGLKRLLWSMRDTWHTEYAPGAEKALEILSKAPFDVIVTDIRMPGTDGLELLEKVKADHPGTARIVLSGHTEMEALLQSTAIVHQFLAKPCEMDALKAVIQQLVEMKTRFDDPHLTNLISDISTLPSLPSLYSEIMEEIKHPNSSMKKVGQIIEKDLGMTAKILQLVNSAFFGLPQKVATPFDAACLLGTDILRALVLSIGLFSQFNTDRMKHFSLEDLFEHGLLTATLSMRICRAESMDKAAADAVFMSALLHDIGRLILAHHHSRQYDNLLQTVNMENADLSTSEKQLFGASHAEIGGYLMGLWGFSLNSINAVTFHHSPSFFHEMECGVLYAADLFANHCGNHPGGEWTLPDSHTGVIDRKGLLHRFEAWRTLCCGDKDTACTNVG